jgi:pilus assembly protein FimV
MDGSTKRMVTRISIVGLGLLPMISFALGLGDIQIESRLNQALRARIEIVDVTDEEWHQIHARIHQEASLDHDVIHSELLGAITVRAVDLDHRHFIELRTGESITEPLFDLPVELVGPKSRLIRSYSILLDPPGADEAAPVRLVAASPAAAASPEPGHQAASRSESTTPGIGPIGTHRDTSLRKGTKQHAARSRRSESNKPVPTPATTAAVSSVQHGLKSQLEMLQRTLARMQETISAQNEQIVRLTAEMSAQSQSRVARPMPPAPGASPRESSAPAAAAAGVGDASSQSDDLDDGDSPNESGGRAMYFWIAGLAMTIAGFAIAVFVWKRKVQAARTSSPEPGPLKLSEPPASLFQAPVERLPVAEPSPPRASFRPVAVREPPKAPSPAPAPASAPVPTARMPTPKLTPLTEAPADTEALPEEYLEELPAAYIAKMPGTSGTDLDLDVTLPLSALGGLANDAAEPPPLSPKPPGAANAPLDSPAPGWKSVEAANAPPASAGATEQARALVAQDGRSLVNKEIAEILEKSLGNDPGRVDIRLKLLEIYHHEARGNRAEFNSLVRNLIADPRALTPAQRQHVEKLQRTLGEESSDSAAEFVAKVAI